jgi:hypothetical protein
MKLEQMTEPEEAIPCDLKIIMSSCNSDHPEKHDSPPIHGKHIRFETVIDLDSENGYIKKCLDENQIDIDYDGFIVLVSEEFLEDVYHYHDGLIPNIKKVKIDGLHFPLKRVFQGKLNILVKLPEKRSFISALELI